MRANLEGRHGRQAWLHRTFGADLVDTPPRDGDWSTEVKLMAVQRRRAVRPGGDHLQVSRLAVSQRPLDRLAEGSTRSSRASWKILGILRQAGKPTMALKGEIGTWLYVDSAFVTFWRPASDQSLRSVMSLRDRDIRRRRDHPCTGHPAD